MGRGEPINLYCFATDKQLLDVIVEPIFCLVSSSSVFLKCVAIIKLMVILRSVIVGRGEQLSVARPPGRVRGAPQARKVKNNRVE